MTEHSTSADKTERRFRAVPVSDGVACGPVRLILRDSGEYVPRYTIDPASVTEEIDRLAQALQGAAENLDAVIELVGRQVGHAQANIFVAQQMMVRDEVLKQEAVKYIEDQRLNAEAACVDVLDAYESRLLEVDNEYLKDRASDIGEVRRRILDMFRKDKADAVVVDETPAVPDDGPRILVAEELLPGETVTLNSKNTAGFLTARGGTASHVAILARAMGIPAVSGVTDLMRQISPDDRVLINGGTGELIINPTRQTLNLYPALRRITPARFQTAPPVPGFTVLANISAAEEVELALQMDAEGVGLYRTEFEFIVADRILDETEQYERYAHVVSRMGGRPVYIRLADLGGDKAARFLQVPREENPALGYRGARLLLGQPELLTAQARAIARASQHGPVHVVYPMIVDEQQFLKLRTQFMQSIDGIDAGTIKHGLMFEVPAACICAKAIFKVADFGSIGSNDLVQYLFAVDRDNGLVAGEYTPDRPAFWTMIEHIAASAAEMGRPLSLCGEMGGQPQYLPSLIARGIRSVSVSPRLIGLARITARRGRHVLDIQQGGKQPAQTR